MKNLNKIIMCCFFMMIFFPSLLIAQDDNRNEEGLYIGGFDFDKSHSTKDIIETESGGAEYKHERVAVIVGVEKYIDRNIMDLKYSVDDAQFINTVLINQGYFTTNYIADDSTIQPSKDNILSALDEVLKIQEDKGIKTFVFYFGGHGFNVSGANYLAPTDTESDDIVGTAISLTEVINKVKKIQENGAKIMMFLDACRNDPNKSKKSMNTDFWRDEESQGLRIMYSTSVGDYSYEIEGHGIFTLYLVKGLLGAADQIDNGGNKNHYVSFLEVAKYVKNRLKKFTLKYGLKQEPRIDAHEAMGDFNITLVDESGLNPPNYISDEHKIDVSIDDDKGVIITWETDKETIGTLFIESSSNFIITDSVKKFYDLSTDGVNHKVVIKYDEIDVKGEYYFKTKDQDFLEQTIISDEYHIPESYIYDTLFERFIEETNESYGILKVYIENKEYDTAILSCNKINRIISKYNEVLDLTERKREIDNLSKVLEFMKDGERYFRVKNYEEAIKNFEGIDYILKEEALDKYIDRESISTKIYKLSNAIKALQLLEKGDEYYEAGDYMLARFAYNDCIELINNEDIEEYVSIEEVRLKIDKIPDLLHKFYFQLGGGISMNMNVKPIRGVYPTWSLFFNYRINRMFAVGGGLNTVFLDLYGKFSPINTTWQRPFASELAFKLGVLFNFAPDFGLGGIFTAEYMLGLNEYIHLYAGLGLWMMSHFEYTSHVPVNVFIRIGTVINLG